MRLLPRFEEGAKIGELLVKRKLGEGAFGVVYLAHDPLVGRDVALKLVPEGATDQDRAIAVLEARAVGRLNHPNIAALYHVHEPGDLHAWMFEFEYVEGATLEARLQGEDPLGPELVEVAVRAIGSALVQAHERGVVHGDIKPGNVMIGVDGSIKLVDFGLARLHGDISRLLSDSEHPGGTPLYMAPELVMGQPPTAHSDLWSFGVLIYRLLAGHTPFRGHGVGGLFHAILNEDPEPIVTPAPNWMIKLIERCLQKDPLLRPSGAEALPAATRPDHTVDSEWRTTSTRPRFGQSEYLRRLNPILQSLRDGSGNAVLLTGGVGSGKSALLHTVRSQCRALGARWVECTVSALHGFQRPLLAELEGVVGLADRSDEVFDVSASTIRLLHALHGDEAAEPPEESTQLYWMLESILLRLAKQAPLCLAIEDAHAASPEDLALIRHLAHYLAAAGVLVIVTMRPDGDAPQSLLSIADAVHIEIAPLAPADLFGLIEQNFESSMIHRSVLQRVSELSEGNPLVCTELTRHLVNTAAVIESEGAIVPGPAWTNSRVPRRLRQLLESRLAILDEDDRHLLDIAAVDGVQFDARAVAAVTGAAVLDTTRALQRMRRRRGLVRPTRDGYRFDSGAIQEVLYDELAPEMRRVVHAAIAEHLETRTDVVAPRRVGIHWRRGGCPERAKPFLQAAMKEALRRFEWSRARELAEPAGLSIASMNSSQIIEHAEVLLPYAYGLAVLGDPQQSLEVTERMEQAAEEFGEGQWVLRTRIASQYTRYYHQGRDHVDTEAVSSALRELDDCREAANGHFLLGAIDKYEQRYDDAERNLQEAIAVCHRCNYEATLARCLNELAGVFLRRGHLPEARGLFDDAARIAEHSGRRESAALSRVNAAITAFSRGELAGLADSLLPTVRELSAAQAPATAAGARIVLANILWSEGRTQEAHELAEAALTIGEGAGHIASRINARRILAELVGAQGDLERAQTLYSEALDLLRRSGNERVLRTVHGLAMRFALWSGDHAGAASEARPCIDQLRTDEGEAARILIDLGEGIFFGLPGVLVREVEEVLPELHFTTPETEAAVAFAHVNIAARRGELRIEDVDRFLALPLAYRRAQCHLEARVLRGTETAEELTACAASLDHHWISPSSVRR